MVGATAFVPWGKVGITLATVVCLGAPSSMSNAAFGLTTVLSLTGINTIKYCTKNITVHQVKVESVMSRNYKKMTDAYQTTERNAIVETEDPHQLVLVMFDALIKSIEVYVDNLDVKTADLELRSKHFSRALTIIYSLQSSLDFEKGGDIADNLFQTYEFARQMIIGSIKDMDETGPKRALALLTEIREAWAQMGEQLSNEK